MPRLPQKAGFGARARGGGVAGRVTHSVGACTRGHGGGRLIRPTGRWGLQRQPHPRTTGRTCVPQTRHGAVHPGAPCVAVAQPAPWSGGAVHGICWRAARHPPHVRAARCSGAVKPRSTCCMQHVFPGLAIRCRIAGCLVSRVDPAAARSRRGLRQFATLRLRSAAAAKTRDLKLVPRSGPRSGLLMLLRPHSVMHDTRGAATAQDRCAHRRDCQAPLIM